MSNITISEESKYFDDSDVLLLVEQAKNRFANRRVGDRALQRIIDRQQYNIDSLVRRRLHNNPSLDYHDFYSAAVEGIINRLETFDPTKGKLDSWLFYGISQGLDKLCSNDRKNYLAKQTAPTGFDSVHCDADIDTVLYEKVEKYISGLKPQIQRIIQLVSQGWRFTEIGELLGKTPDSIRMAYNRAIKIIKNALEPKPKSKPAKGWFRNIFVRNFKAIGQLFCKHSKALSSMSSQKRPSFLFRSDRVTTSRRFKFPYVLTPKGKTFSLVILGIIGSLLLHAVPAQAQCAGWLCGARDAVVANDMWGAGNQGSDVIINGGFLLLQLIAAVLCSIPLIVAAVMGIRREDYTPFVLGSLVIFAALTGVNFIAGWIFGV